MPSESFPVDRIERTLRQQLGIVLSPLRAIGLLRTLLLPLALVASLLLALPALSAAENTISGTVSLPDGHTATEGMYVTVYVQTEDYSASAFATAYIAAGESEGTYTLTVPSEVSASWQVYYVWSGGTFLRNGFYSESGTQWKSDQATLLSDGTDHNNIDLALLVGNTISGIVSLPSGRTAPEGGMSVSFYAYNQNDQSDMYWGTAFIATGEGSASYTLIVAPDAGASWQLRYNYWGEGTYLQQGFYSTAGTQWQSEQATLLRGGTNHDGIDLALLTGNTISGTVSRPAGSTAPGEYVYVYADNRNGSVIWSATFLEAGAASGSYALIVPTDAGFSWAVHYTYGGSEAYLQTGYYSSDGTQWRYDKATLLQGGAHYSGINLILLTTNTISGLITLPDSQVAPTDGLSVNVCFSDGNAAQCTSFTIPANSSGTGYTITLPSDANASWQLSYSYWGGDSYLNHGYYSEEGTQWQAEQADLLQGGMNYNSIDLILLKGKTISGTVFLPDGRTATEDMYVSVSAQTSDYSASASATAFIPAGASDGTYTLTISPDTNVSWQVYYSYWGGEAYQHWGYYNDIVGTLTMPEQATLLQGGQDHSGINLTLLINYTISGTVSLPEGHKAPDGGLKVSVVLWDENYGYGDEFVIPAGESSVSYSLSMPSDTTVSKRVGYSFGWGTTGAYLEQGYYSTAGTQWQLAQATPLSGGQEYTGINLTLLTGNTISGTVSLPGGRKAPAGGLSVRVNATGPYGNSTTVVIPENATSAPYAIAVVPDPSASWQIGCSEEGDDATYLSGYYNTAGTTWFWDWATPVPGGADRSNINLTLLVGKTITGTVSLPAGQKAPAGGLSIEVILDTDIGIDGAYHWTTVTLAEGEASAPYTFTVPDDPETFWTVRYSGLSEDEAGSLYLPEGYYNTSGTQWRQESATLLPGAEHSNVNLTLLTGSTISGTVSLPTGISAPDGGIYIDVYVYDTYRDNYFSDKTVFVPAGQNSANYTLAVPNDASASWQFFYFYYAEEGTNLEHCLREGYYSSTVTQWRDDLATPVQGGVDWSGINLTLLLGKTISGIASPPPGLPFDDGVDIDVCAVNDLVRYQWIYCDYIGVASDSAGEAYKVTVPQDAAVSWTVRYDLDLQSRLDNPNNFLQTGYYNTSGTQWRSSLATPVQGGVDRSGIDLPLLVGDKTISGTVSLPAADSRGVLVAFSVSDPNDLNNPVSTGYVNLGGNFAPSATYSLPVPVDADVAWTLWYEDYGIDWYYSESKYVNPGYYNATGTRWRADAATPVAGGDDRTGIDMVLLQPTTISGTVSLPAGQTAPAGGTTVSVQVSEQTNMDALAGSRYITIPGGRASAPYSVFVPIDPSALWAVRYSYDGPGDYLIQGYFSIAGTRADLVNATLLDGGAPLTGVNLTLLRSQDLDPDTDGDNLPDAWEIVYFGNLTTANGTTDYDRDGYTDLQEYLNDEQGETDPLGAAYDPKQGNAPGGTGYVSISSDEGFWEIMTPVIINSAREAASR